MKILRLFLSNPDTCYTPQEVSTRAKVHIQTTHKELRLLAKIGCIKKEQCVQHTFRGRGKNRKEVQKKVQGVIIDRSFEHFHTLRNFILNIAPTDEQGILKKVSGSGKIKLVITAGVFIHEPSSRVDILIVGDALQEARLRSAIRDLEAHMGQELRYAAFSTADFTYRLSVYDRLVRDVLDYPHQVLVDALPPTWKDVGMQKAH